MIYTAFLATLTVLMVIIGAVSSANAQSSTGMSSYSSTTNTSASGTPGISQSAQYSNRNGQGTSDRALGWMNGASTTASPNQNKSNSVYQNYTPADQSMVPGQTSPSNTIPNGAPHVN